MCAGYRAEFEKTQWSYCQVIQTLSYHHQPPSGGDADMLQGTHRRFDLGRPLQKSA